MPDKEPDPIQEMINQLNDMVRLVQEKKFNFSDKPLPPGIDDMMNDLENQVKIFCQITDETLQDLGISKEEVQKRLKEPPESMTIAEKRKIRQINHLKMDVDQIKSLLSIAARRAKKFLAAPPTDKKKKRIQKHKKRYKRLGGDSQWKSV